MIINTSSMNDDLDSALILLDSMLILLENQKDKLQNIILNFIILDNQNYIIYCKLKNLCCITVTINLIENSILIGLKKSKCIDTILSKYDLNNFQTKILKFLPLLKIIDKRHKNIIFYLLFFLVEQNKEISQFLSYFLNIFLISKMKNIIENS